MKKFLIIISVIVTSFILFYISLLLYIDKMAEQDTKVKSDIILVLGGEVISGTSCYGAICQHGFIPHPHYNPCVVARVDHAVSLYKNHYAPKILMSGGTDKDTNKNEAEIMKKMAVEAGVPEANMEKKSTSTYENFVFSQEILNEAGLHTVIIATEPYQIARAELVASKLQYKYSVSPAVDSPCWNQDKNNLTKREFIHEAWALIGYKILNKI
jgi:uncharacterized SAM-binding protein YcdF (DUF218 family)